MKKIAAVTAMLLSMSAIQANAHPGHDDDADLLGTTLTIYTENASKDSLGFQFIKNTNTVVKAAANPLTGNSTDQMVLRTKLPVLSDITYRYSTPSKSCEFTISHLALGYNAKASSVGQEQADCTVVQAPSSSGSALVTRFKMQ